MADLERIYVVPLRSVYGTPRTARSKKAVKVLRSFISRHMKAEDSDISISQGVNSLIWKRGIQKPPRKIKVRAVKAGEKVTVMLLDEKASEVKVEKKPEKKAEKKKETPAEKPEEAAAPKAEEKPAQPEKKEEPKAEPKEEPKPPVEAPAEKPEAPKKE